VDFELADITRALVWISASDLLQILHDNFLLLWSVQLHKAKPEEIDIAFGSP
jgi:hypothetical protein